MAAASYFFPGIPTNVAMCNEHVKKNVSEPTRSEMNDICAALKILSEKDCMPMFLSTSNMVSQTPIYNLYPVEGDNSEVTARLKIVEESLNSIMTSEKMKINNLQSDPTVRTTLTDKKEVKQNQLECTSQLVANGDTWADIVGENAKPLDTKITEENIGDNGCTNVSSKIQKKKTWRQRLNILRGTSASESDGEVLSADIHLVAFGVAKHVSGIQLSHFLKEKAYMS